MRITLRNTQGMSSSQLSMLYTIILNIRERPYTGFELQLEKTFKEHSELAEHFTYRAYKAHGWVKFTGTGNKVIEVMVR